MLFAPLPRVAAALLMLLTVLAGDAAAAPSGAITRSLAPASTPTATLTATPNPCEFGQQIRFIATITGSSPTGKITFLDTTSGATLGSIAIYAGAAVFYYDNAAGNPTQLSVGTHQIVASYGGDSKNNAAASAPLTQTGTVHVNPQYVSPQGNDTNPGTLAAPKRTLQAAINAAFSGDTVVAEDGLYTGLGNVDLGFGGRNLTVTSQNGPAATVIDCGGSASMSHRAFSLSSGEATTVISGLTIQNGYETGDSGGAIANFSNTVATHMTIQNCIFRKNAALYGGAFFYPNYFTRGTGSLTVTNCVFTGNTAQYFGGAIFNSNHGGTITVTGCTLTGNSAQSGGGGGIFDDNATAGGTTVLTDDILYGDTGGEIVETNLDAFVTYSDIQGGSAGTGRFDADPLFVSAPANLHLQAGSPCLGMGTGAGAPPTDLDGNPRRDPPSVGAYEYAYLPPAANARSVTTPQDTPVAVTLTGSDPNGLPLTYTVVTPPTHGTLTGTVPSLTYTPAPGYFGPDAFQFTVGNGFARSAPATVSLTVTPGPPVLTVPTPVAGGTLVTATLTLSSPAQADMVVGLSSSDSSAVHFHRALVIPAGATSASFPIKTYHRPSLRFVTITATLGTVVVTKNLIITGG